jgi:hypothetical protein
MKAVAVGLFVCVVGLAGCTMERPRLSNQGVPTDQRYLVAGGTVFQYKAPWSGVMVLVDQTHNRAVFTKSLEAGESFELTPSMFESSDAVKWLGPNPETNTYLLYFLPHPPAAATQASR